VPAGLEAPAPGCGAGAYADITMAFVRYTALRLLIFVIAAALLWIIGLRGFALLLFAVLLSGIVSLFVLNRSRDELSTALVGRQQRIRQRLADRTAAEDEWNDDVRDGAGPDGRQGSTR
jgi:Protein of unknown function (DUF4229)